MLFKEVDSKFSFEFDKDFTLKQIFLLIIIKLEYKQDYAFKIFKRGRGWQNVDTHVHR